ncbi:MAG: hypothetical protein HWE10_04240 [Gammaproteobacteria bacterium]|nr:hypothetical protein [Gammaproteobacteria bacterium]
MKTFIYLLLLFSVADIYANENNPLTQCRNIQNDNDRLACYDKIPLTTVATNLPEKSADKKTNQPISASDKFGLKQPVEEQLESIFAKVTKLKKVGYGSFIIHMDNEQIWRQIDSARFRLKVGDEVEIKSASLGSFLLKKAGSNKTIRVKRLQ